VHRKLPAKECRSSFVFHWLSACRNCLSGPIQRDAFLLLFLGMGLALAQPCGAASIGFENTGSLVTARFRHTATLLSDGRVLVVTGNTSDGPVASAELYDPASGIWTATGRLGFSVLGHTATLLPNGKVLVAGGGFLVDYSSAELYDPATETWTATGSMTGSRYDHTATLLPNGKVLVAGGFTRPAGSSGHPLATAEIYDPASGTWTTTGSMALARTSHTATLLPNGKVLVAGGDYMFGSVELYDPASGTWATTGNLPGFGLVGHTATLLSNGKVLVAGGGDTGQTLARAELYDPATGTWMATGSLATGRSFHTATLLAGNQVLVVGGSPSDGNPLASAELYDPASETWMATGSLATARTSHTATLLSSNQVLVAGGLHDASGDPVASAELYGTAIPTLLNISTRLRVQPGDNAMIGGFIITGTQPKTVIIRGIGTSLAVLDALADPVIELHGSAGELLATNDNWREDPNQQHVSDAGLAPTNDLESALWETLNPGAYTVVLSDRHGGSGVGLVEAYDLDRTVDSNLANISTRGFVDSGDNVMIGGLIVGGGNAVGSARVVVRALGPSIPVAGALSDPTLELHDGSGTLVDSNNDWKTRPDGSSQQAEIEATAIPPTNDLESALVRTLSPGNYTTIVRGVNNTTGVGLVEAYHLP
jgi:hypothetical protein